MINQRVFSDNKGNEIRFSKVNQVDTKVHFKDFSIKYVLEGQEHYRLNQKKIHLKKGQFLVGNAFMEAEVLIDTNDETKGICIDVSRELISDVVDYHFKNTTLFKDFLFHHEVILQKHIVSDGCLGKSIQNLDSSFEQLLKTNYQFQPDVMMKIAEGIVQDHYQMYQSYQSLSFKKEETNNRIFDFMLDAKNFIDTHFLSDISIENMSQEAKLSTYHFIRLFKKMFKTTPYQYVLEKRLELANEMIRQQHPIVDVISLTGFADHASFSKSFKAKYQIAPSKLK
jgi:AraC-like DNA-binding protein